MSTFRITWEIEGLEADSPEEAAQHALALLRDRDSTTLTFDVQNHEFQGTAGSVRLTNNTGFSRVDLAGATPRDRLVRWEINTADDWVDPFEAAARVWRDNFGRTEANPDDACVFTVVETDGTQTTVDLSDTSLAHTYAALDNPDQE
jgi:hypothetical protein